MRLLALVVARSGSKRLPGENMRLLGGKPLLAWTLDAALGAEGLCDVLLSTDGQDMADLASERGALAPWLRPAELASETAGAVDVCLHALDWYEAAHGAVDGLLLLQPTSPFRTSSSIEAAIALFAEERRTVLSLSPAATHPYWCFRVDGRHMTPFVEAEDLRSEALPPAFALNGAIYLIAPDVLRHRRSFFSDDAVPLILEDPAEAVDIDTADDWHHAEAVLAERA